MVGRAAGSDSCFLRPDFKIYLHRFLIVQRRYFYIPVAVAIAIFGILNVAVSVLARNTNPRQIARHIEQEAELNCLALGNSLMRAGFDEEAFEGRWLQAGRPVRALNAGLGSSYPVEHLMLLRKALQSHPKLDVVFYGFFDFQLTTLPDVSPKDLVGNRAMLYYFEPAAVPEYYRWSALDRFVFQGIRLLPALQERGVIWEKVEMARRRLGQIGMPAEAVNRFGKVRDFQLLEAANTQVFERECEREISGRKPLSKPIADMVRLAKEHGTRLVIVEMPMHPSHVNRYYQTPGWTHYRGYVRRLLASEGASYLQADDWIQDERLFADHLHASPPGAALFSRKLATVEVTNQREVF